MHVREHLLRNCKRKGKTKWNLKLLPGEINTGYKSFMFFLNEV